MSGDMFEASLAQNYAECGRVARESERDLWLAALFAPERLRPHLHAIAAFAHETRRIGERVREPLAGEMRLAWWREALAGKRPDEAAGNPVAAALAHTIARFALPVAEFEDWLQALTIDVYHEEVASIAELEAYGRSTFGAQIAAQARVLAEGRQTNASGASFEAGAGLALSFVLFEFAGAGRSRRLPRELLERHGAASAASTPERSEGAPHAALDELAAAAQARFDAAEARLDALPAALTPAFASLATARLDLRRWRRAGGKSFRAAAPWRRQWALWLWLRRR